ncbi:hypothetical protein HDV05_000253 [Chytridiales sp. JEL 0842]|nr:hypothetical protein HDV05_000253 [Chytridiales sp. JEL 0842]
MGKGDFINQEEDDLREQDRYLPIANVARIMKRALPDNAKIAKDSKECVQECVSEFISFITSEASDRCQLEKRKTINGDDILWAMQSLGFDNYADVLRVYLGKYRETTKVEKYYVGGKDDEDVTEEETMAAITSAGLNAFTLNQNALMFTSNQQRMNPEGAAFGDSGPGELQGSRGQ